MATCEVLPPRPESGYIVVAPETERTGELIAQSEICILRKKAVAVPYESQILDNLLSRTITLTWGDVLPWPWCEADNADEVRIRRSLEDDILHTARISALPDAPIAPIAPYVRQLMSAADIDVAGVSTTFCSDDCRRPQCLSLNSHNRRLIFCRAHLCTNDESTCDCFPYSIDKLWEGNVDWTRFGIELRNLHDFPRWFLYRPAGQDRTHDPLYINAVKKLLGSNLDVPTDQRIPHTTGFYVKKSWVEQQQKLRRWM